MSSHLGQSVVDHVVLSLVGGVKGGYGPSKLDWMRIFADGSHGGQFRVPKGAALVVTDVDWHYAHESAPGMMQVFRLFIAPLSPGPGEGETGYRVFESAVVLGPDRSGGASVAMTAGFVVSSKARIGVDVLPGPLGPPGGVQHSILRGYLTPESLLGSLLLRRLLTPSH
jgi:hypothetical protein